MEFIELQAKNFCTLEDVTLSLDRQGLVTILGENRDAPKASSNGAGKSLLFDALCWGLWGQTPRGQKDDAVVSRFVGKDCYVKVTFKDGNDVYTVERFRKSTEHKKPNDIILTVNGKCDTAAKMSLTQDRINNILGFDFITFVTMMPGVFSSAAELTDSAIKQLLEKLLQTETFPKAHELAKSKLKTAQTELMQVKAKLDLAAAKISGHEVLLSDYTRMFESFDEDKEKKIWKLNADYAELTNQILKIQKELTELDSIEEVTKKLEEKRDKVSELLGKLKTRHHQIECDFEGEEIAACMVVASKARAEYVHANKEYERVLHLADKCSVCYQPVKDDFKIEKLGELKDKADDALAHSEQMEAELRASKTKFLEIKEAHTQQYNTFEQEILSLKESILANKTKLSSKKALHNNKILLEQQQKKVSDEVWELQHQENPFKQLIDKLLAENVETVSEHSRLQAADLQKNKEVEQLEFWVEAFSARGIRSYVLKQITPVLNERAKFYADILTDGEMEVKFHTERELANGNIKEEFNIEVVQKHGGNSYAGNSNGEKGRADLVIAFTLGDLATLRSNKIVKFRFLDEPFESIDSVGIDAVINLLTVMKDKYDTVFVITHSDYLKELITKKLLVVKENAKSNIEVINE